MLALGIAAAALAGFALSGAYYSVVPLGPSAAQERAPSAGVQAVTELLRSAAVAALVAGLMRAGGWDGVGRGALLGLSLWVLPVVLLIGSIVHEGTSVRAGALHAGDWLVKLVVIGVIIGSFV